MTRFEAVVFDLDNTLCRSEQSGEALYRRAFDHVGVEPVGTPEALWAALGDHREHGARERLTRGFAAVLADSDADPAADPAALAEGFLAAIDPTAVSILPGATEALAAARAAGPVGLLTNGPERRQRPKLRTLGIESAFDAAVFAEDLGRRKPDRHPFERVLAALDVSAPGTLYVGDSPEYDIAGAHAAGLQVALVTNGHDRDLDGHDPEFVLDSVGGVVDLLEGDGD